jgi:hypothetical protein
MMANFNSIHRETIGLDQKEILVTGRIIKAAVSRTDPESGIDIWWEHHTWNPYPSPVRVFVAGTGHTVPWHNPAERDMWRYVDSCVTPMGFVWHVYVGAENR